MASGGTNLGIRIRVDVSDGVDAVDRLFSSLRRLTEQSFQVDVLSRSLSSLGRSASEAGRHASGVSNLSTALNNTSNNIQLVNRHGVPLVSTFQQIEVNASGASRSVRQTRDAFDRLASLIPNVNQALAIFGGFFTGAAILRGARNISRFNDEMTAARNRLLAVTGSQRAASQEFELFSDILTRNGFALRNNLQTLTNFTNASLGAGESIEEVNSNIERLTGLARNLNLSESGFSDLVNTFDNLLAGRNFDLIRQGTLNRLGISPGDIQRALGFSTLDEFETARSRGQVGGRETVQALLDQSQRAGANPFRETTVEEATQRLSNNFDRMAERISRRVNPALAKFIDGLADFFDDGQTPAERAEQRETEARNRLRARIREQVESDTPRSVSRNTGFLSYLGYFLGLNSGPGSNAGSTPNLTQVQQALNNLSSDERTAMVLARVEELFQQALEAAGGSLTGTNLPEDGTDRLGTRASMLLQSLENQISRDLSRGISMAVQSFAGLSDQAFSLRESFRSLERGIIDVLAQGLAEYAASGVSEFFGALTGIRTSDTRTRSQTPGGGTAVQSGT